MTGKYKKSIVFDLETIADQSMLSILPAIEPDIRLKDPKKIEINIAKKKQAQIEKMGLDPMFNIICVAGWCDENGPGFIKLSADPEDSSEKILAAEKELLIEFWEVLSKYDKFITFNGRNFDIRVMMIHGITHGIRCGVNIDHGRYNRGNHIDLRFILAGDGQFAKGKLDFFCKKFLGEGKMEGIDGALVQEYWDYGLINDIVKYNQDEVQKMWDLYLMVEVAGLIQ